MCQKSNRQAEIWQREDNQRALVSLVAFLDPVPELLELGSLINFVGRAG